MAEQPAPVLTDGEAARIWQSLTAPHEVGKNLAPVVPPVAIQYARAIIAAAIPPGWAVVPVEPTDAMLAAADNAPERTNARTRNEDNAAIYAAMIAARPGAPK